MEIIEIQKLKNKQMNRPIKKMNIRCDLGKLIQEKTKLEGEATLFCLLFSYENENMKKGALTMKFPLTLWLE